VARQRSLTIWSSATAARITSWAPLLCMQSQIHIKSIRPNGINVQRITESAIACSQRSGVLWHPLDVVGGHPENG